MSFANCSVDDTASRPFSISSRRNASMLKLMQVPPCSSMLSSRKSMRERIAVWIGTGQPDQFELLGVEYDGQNSVPETIVVENTGKAGADNGADAKLCQSPNRVLAAGAAAEIGSDHEKFRAAVGRAR